MTNEQKHKKIQDHNGIKYSNKNNNFYSGDINQESDSIILLVSECLKCGKVEWPTNNYCSNCFNGTRVRSMNREGIIMEYSSKDGIFICVAEFEGGDICLIGELKIREGHNKNVKKEEKDSKTIKKPNIHQKIILKKFQINSEQEYSFEFSPKDHSLI